MDKRVVQLIDFNNSTWELMRTHMKEIEEFLSTRDKTPAVVHLMALSIKLILSEFVTNEKYRRIPAKIYSDEDFVDMVIDSMNSRLPDIKDIKATEAYIEENRQFIWGHIKMYAKRISEILIEVGDAGDTKGILTDKDGDIFLECLTVAWVECNLRDRETRMLENTYGE